jgi:TRAP-type C4-dicarboxylate transport system permease small subunit
MALMLALPLSSATLIGYASGTPSDNIIACCAITIGLLIFLLAWTDVMSKGDHSSARKVAALRAVYTPLIVSFCVFLVFVVTQMLKAGAFSK